MFKWRSRGSRARLGKGIPGGFAGDLGDPFRGEDDPAMRARLVSEMGVRRWLGCAWRAGARGEAGWAASARRSGWACWAEVEGWAAGKERGEEVWAGLVSCWAGSRLSFLFSFSISFLFQTPHKLFEFK